MRLLRPHSPHYGLAGARLVGLHGLGVTQLGSLVGCFDFAVSLAGAVIVSSLGVARNPTKRVGISASYRHFVGFKEA